MMVVLFAANKVGKGRRRRRVSNQCAKGIGEEASRLVCGLEERLAPGDICRDA
jgi:hypothetical protein